MKPLSFGKKAKLKQNLLLSFLIVCGLFFGFFAITDRQEQFKRISQEIINENLSCPFTFSSLEDLFQLTSLSPTCTALSARFRALYDLHRERHSLAYPPFLAPKLARLLGSAAPVDSLRRQNLTRLTNVWTAEEMIFNPLRSKRPSIGGAGAEQRRLAEELLSRRPCDLCEFRQETAQEEEGRLENDLAATFANSFPFSGEQIVVFPKKHSALELNAADADAAADLVDAWFQRAERRDSYAARHRVILIDHLRPAGASQSHFHLHGVAQDTAPPGRARALLEAARRYDAAHSGRAFFDDLFGVHEALGLCVTREAAVLCAHLTPVKNREILFRVDAARPDATRQILRAILGVARFFFALDRYAFSGAVYLPTPEEASTTPAVGRFIPRADIGATYGDVGTMELFVRSVVDVDPFVAAANMKDKL